MGERGSPGKKTSYPITSLSTCWSPSGGGDGEGGGGGRDGSDGDYDGGDCGSDDGAWGW